ncbi:uncharacterized protein LOC144551891 [Carex rostrata]
MGSSTPRLLSLQDNLWAPSENLTADQCLFLQAPFSLEEIKRVVFACNPSKAPGPDGMSFQFYQSFWDILKDDLLRIFTAFYNNNLDISKFNLASICLIPKKEDATTVRNFRPISLINCSFKLITKLLADRLALVMDSLIDSSQTAYIKDDTLLFLKADKVVLTHIRWLLVAFENVSGLKINYDKSEMYPLNLLDTKTDELASILRCKISSLPLTYLGVPINNKSLTDINWQLLIDKIEKRLQGWKGSLLSLGDDLWLLDASIPLKDRLLVELLRGAILWNVCLMLPCDVNDLPDQILEEEEESTHMSGDDLSDEDLLDY